MLSALTASKEIIDFQESAEPALESGHALVRIHNVTLCGTDLHIWEDDYPTELPIIQGHEFSGIVEAIGPNQAVAPGEARINIGDRVAVNPMIYCGACQPCLTGRYNVCQNVGCLGCYSDGALVELITVPLDKLCPRARRTAPGHRRHGRAHIHRHPGSQPRPARCR